MIPESLTRLPGGRLFAITALVLLGSTLLAAAAMAQSAVDPATIDLGHPTGHLHDHGDQTWPPQPPGIRNVVPLGNPAREQQEAKAREGRANARDRIAMASPDVLRALGERYTRAAFIEDRDKAGAVRSTRLVYYSYSNDSTVEVTFTGQRLAGIRNLPAVEYQPEITDGEIAEAEAIARSYFMASGENRVVQLQAFGILAYQPIGKGFYATRVLYISFHRDSDSPPEYVAWVDLSGQRVLRARKEGQ